MKLNCFKSLILSIALLSFAPNSEASCGRGIPPEHCPKPKPIKSGDIIQGFADSHLIISFDCKNLSVEDPSLEAERIDLFETVKFDAHHKCQAYDLQVSEPMGSPQYEAFCSYQNGHFSFYMSAKAEFICQ